MNHLAHATLAAHDDGALVGALLSDFVKGAVPAAYAPHVRVEIQLHREVDVFTDAHPAVREAVACFAPERRRFAGIALDLHFDHLLARGWARHAGRPDLQAGADLHAFARRACDAVDGFEAGPMAEGLALMSRRWRAHGDGLAAYADEDATGFALDRTARRLVCSPPDQRG